MYNSQYALTDQEIQQFILRGFLTIQANSEPSLHEEIHDELERVYANEGNIGNNILPRIPQIQKVFDDPAVHAALTGLLGPDYIMNPHRHGHLNPPGSKGQTWHKDCYVYDHNLRHPRFQWVLAFYYPQDTDADMGPSAIIPGHQDFKTISAVDPDHTTESAMPLVGAAGTVTLINFDAWHRATANVSQKNRYMLKFQFARMSQPSSPLWHHESATWATPESQSVPGLSRDVWHWLGGGLSSPTNNGKVNEADLFSDDEYLRLNVAYDLAAQEGSESLLIEAMRRETRENIEDTTATTADNAHVTNPTAGAAARALSSTGSRAVTKLAECLRDDLWWIKAMSANILARIGPAAKVAEDQLVHALADDHWWVRRNALEALRTLGPLEDCSIHPITNALHDADYRVRRNAALALCHLGEAGACAVPALLDVLEDENRYNRFYAALALRRIGTPKATNALLDSLFMARWCPLTSAESRY